MTNLNTAINNTSALQLKGSMLTLTVLHLLQPDVAAIRAQLRGIINKNPQFFHQAPIIIDLEKLATASMLLDFTALRVALLEANLIPVAVRNATAEQGAAAFAAGFGVLPHAKQDTPKSSPTKPSISKIITHQVRSGQQVHAEQGDLVIVGSVSAGAELLAAGHIHVYGTLRGRAFAGVYGNVEARIFCHQLEAELVAIAGYYRVQEAAITTPAPQRVQILLNEEKQLVVTEW